MVYIFKISTLNTTHFELLMPLNKSISKGDTELCLVILLFKYLQGVTHLLIYMVFLLVNMMDEKYAEKLLLIFLNELVLSFLCP